MTNNAADTSTIVDYNNVGTYLVNQAVDNFMQVTDSAVIPIPFSLPYINAN